MYAIIVGGKSVAVFRRERVAHDWGTERLAVPFTVRAVDMRLSLARSLCVINSRPRLRAPSFHLDIGVY